MVVHRKQHLQFYGILHNAVAIASVDGECMNIHTQECEHNDSVHPVCTSKVRLCVEEAGLQARLPESAGFSNCLISARGAQNTPVTRPKRDFGRKSSAEGRRQCISLYTSFSQKDVSIRDNLVFSPHRGGVALPGTASLLFSLPQPTSSDTM